ncbi:L,D-transpeptidase family protein [Pollutibacter soli]|uniref:L,D-transpeptidase family protein n=1 Tax=Pollutibacter soli TaxID=3034157 RepID=UPI003013D111
MQNDARHLLLYLFFLFKSLDLHPQIKPDEIRHYFQERQSNAELLEISGIEKFYSLLDFRFAWINGDSSRSSLDTIFRLIKRCDEAGLDPADYQPGFLENLIQKRNTLLSRYDSVSAEIRLTQIILQFCCDLAFGNCAPEFRFNSLKYQADIFFPAATLSHCLSAKVLYKLKALLTPPVAEILIIEEQIQKLNAIISSPFFHEVKIISSRPDTSNTALIQKLYQLGVVNIMHDSVLSGSLAQPIKTAQHKFNIPADGILTSITLKEFNIPIHIRLQQLKLSVNYYRWLYQIIRSQSVILVNIPACNMKVYNEDSLIMEMRMVVGKKSTPTPTLTSRIKNVVLYPYWHVPRKIVVNELLPSFKSNPAAVEAGNFQILDLSGNIINPSGINWSKVNADHFPYIVRQSTGCENALGLLKLEFYNPFGVYLHDTPLKSAFMLRRRFFSHGCMRMEMPKELGRLILKNHVEAIDSLDQKGCVRNQAPIIIPADDEMAVVVWYNPVGIDAKGRLIFFEDVYQKFSWGKYREAGNAYIITRS